MLVLGAQLHSVVHGQLPADQNIVAGLIGEELPAFASRAPPCGHPVHDHHAARLLPVLASLEPKLLPLDVARGSEGHHRVHEQHQQRVVPDFRLQTLVCTASVSAVIHFGGGLCRQDRRGAVPNLALEPDQVVADDTPTVANHIHPRSICVCGVGRKVWHGEQFQRIRCPLSCHHCLAVNPHEFKQSISFPTWKLWALLSTCLAWWVLARIRHIDPHFSS
mmetsp:Transcript_57391/g.135093  ORF Transcript_57391/g.135093 Transcript_57391/m.135093 type:complete len:220 (-) Transcript_57391:175-834(-)